METFQSFNSYIQKSIVDNWDRDALTDYQGITLQYHDVARKIDKLHILFENAGVRKGDKIAICGRNSSHWAVAFFATLTYGAVAVPILHEFNADQIHNIVNHSEARLLFVGDFIAKRIQPDEMPALEGIINLPDFSLMLSRSAQLAEARSRLNEYFGRRYPEAFHRTDISYHTDTAGELAMLNYTSGTTGFSKGVMIPYRALWSNLDFCQTALASHIAKGSDTLSILPMAHMYGMMIEFIFPFCHGCHLYFLTRLPSPAVIAEAFRTVRPAIVVSVPLIVEKIIRKRVFPKLDKLHMRLLFSLPVVNKKVKQKICSAVREAFGGRMYEVIVGGAPLNKEVERFLRLIDFPITVGYGATECAPLISFSDWRQSAEGSCGRPVAHIEVATKAGEIVVRGANVMDGYYKNPEATAQAIDSDGWYHTGDLGELDAEGNLYIRGRIKNMLLGANGQNIYPEEIEDKLGSLPLVSECIIIRRDDKLLALIHPDYAEADNLSLSKDELQALMEQNRTELNADLPAYCRIAAVEIREEEFEKTPKKSIKRYLYS